MSEFTPRGQGNLNSVLGAIGTANALMPGLFNNCGGGLFGGNCNTGCCSENTAVNRYELNLTQEIAAKDAENGLLRSQVYTDGKLVDVVKDYTAQINALAAEVRANKDAQTAVNTEQAVYNGTNTATIACIKGQVDCLMGLTKLVVPNTSVCPGWGNVTITPATSTTTSPTA